MRSRRLSWRSYVVGLEHRISGTFSDEDADDGSPDEIIERYDLELADADAFDRSVAHGLIEVDGGRWRVPSPKLLRAGVELRKAGVPVAELLAELSHVRTAIEGIADRMVELIHRHVCGSHLSAGRPALPEVIEVAEVVDRIRPIATTVVSVELARALQDAAGRRVRVTIDKLVTQ